MRAIAVYNPRGGTGKTATAVNLAACLAERGLRVLLLDLGVPSSSATIHCAADETEMTTQDAFGLLVERQPFDAVARPTYFPGIDLIKGSPRSRQLLPSLFGQIGGEMRLRTAVRAERERPDGPRWDMLIVDCPPGLGVVMANALLGVDELIVPLEATTSGLDGASALVETLHAVREDLNPSLRVTGVLLCRYDQTNRARATETELREAFGPLVFNDVIPHHVVVTNAYSYQTPLAGFAPDSPAALAYGRVADKVMRRADPRWFQSYLNEIAA